MTTSFLETSFSLALGAFNAVNVMAGADAESRVSVSVGDANLYLALSKGVTAGSARLLLQRLITLKASTNGLALLRPCDVPHTSVCEVRRWWQYFSFRSAFLIMRASDEALPAVCGPPERFTRIAWIVIFSTMD